MMRRVLMFVLALSGVSVVSAIEKSAAVAVETVLKTTTSWDGTALTYPTGAAEITGMIVDIAPGGETGWHQHPVPSFGMLLEGQLDVHLKDGRVKRLRPGDALAEVANTLHNGRNVGVAPVKILVFYAGAAGEPTTVKEGE